MTTLDRPKAAKRQKQISAKERKRIRVEKLRAKKDNRVKEQGDALLAALDGWRRRSPPEAFTDKCPACRGDIFVTYEHGGVQHAHGEPSCDLYRVFELMMGSESPPIATSKNPELPVPAVPHWADRPAIDLTLREGLSLQHSGDVQNSCRVSHVAPDGTHQTRLLAQTKDGKLYWWVIGIQPQLCPECGGLMVHETRPETIEFAGHERTIDMLAWWCTECEEAIFAGEPMVEYEKVYQELKAEATQVLFSQGAPKEPG